MIKQLRAFTVFLEETREHINWTRAFLSNGGIASPSSVKEAERRFHTIKGGAGFFGLTDVEKLAASLEKFFSTVSASSNNGLEGAVIESLNQLEKRIVDLASQQIADE